MYKQDFLFEIAKHGKFWLGTLVLVYIIAYVLTQMLLIISITLLTFIQHFVLFFFYFFIQITRISLFQYLNILI